MSTEKIYETQGELFELEACVTACHRVADGWEITLDRTILFPGGGGQLPDSGSIGELPVLAIREQGDEIRYTVGRELRPGTQVICCIDADLRRRRMQNHGGEHIISGIAYRKYGYHNVGFHMGEDDITIDFDGLLDRAQLLEIEREANAAIAENRRVSISFPSAAELAVLDYRSKRPLEGRVRIVEIEGMDRCACCAPHFEHTGCIGQIKLLDVLHYKGGVRVHLLCGLDALEDHERRYAATADISARLSVPQAEVAEAVAQLSAEVGRLRGECGELRRRLLTLKAEALPHGDRLCLFETLEAGDMRYLVNLLQERAALCAVFTGDDAAGYKYIMAGRDRDMRALAAEFNRALNGRGGGSAQMVQGSVRASRGEIENYFNNIDL